MKTDSQEKQILNDLLVGASITPLDALNRYGCFRLGARIWDIRHSLNYDVKDEWVVTQNGKRVKCYYLELKPEQTRLLI